MQLDVYEVLRFNEGGLCKSSVPNALVFIRSSNKPLPILSERGRLDSLCGLSRASSLVTMGPILRRKRGYAASEGTKVFARCLLRKEEEGFSREVRLRSLGAGEIRRLRGSKYLHLKACG